MHVGPVEDAEEEQERGPRPGAEHDGAVAAGRWNARRSARKNSSASTPAVTRKIAASTNDSTPNALIESDTSERPTTTFFSYHGRSIEPSSASAATAASR